MKAKIAIVILNWNGRKHLEQFLPSVMLSTWKGLQVVVADNNSSDDSVAFLQEKFPAVRVIRLAQNYGFARGYNEALKQVEAEYYVLLNSDVEVAPGWIEPVLALMDSDPLIAACQPKLLMYKNKTSFEYAGAAGGWIDCLGYPFARGRIFDVCEQDTGQYDTVEPVFWASGAAMFVRAELYHRMEGLDPYFFAHQEEIDLCWRWQLAGYKVMVCPASVVYHLGGGTLPKGNSAKVYLNFRNNLIMLAKNLPLGQALWKIPFRFVLDTISAFKAITSGENITYLTSVWRAHLGFINWLLFHRDQSLFPREKGSRLYGWYNGSVVWKYFVGGKKNFREIIGPKL